MTFWLIFPNLDFLSFVPFNSELERTLLKVVKIHFFPNFRSFREKKKKDLLKFPILNVYWQFTWMSFITLKSAPSISNLLSVFNHGDWWILWNIFLDSIELSIRFCPLLYQKFGLSLNSAVSLPGSTAESMKFKGHSSYYVGIYLSFRVY